MYYSMYKELGYRSEDLQPTDVPLVGFNVATIWPLGKIHLYVMIGSVTEHVEFVVVDCPSPYNAILGRTRVH